jgi:ribosome maturation factor RimP
MLSKEKVNALIAPLLKEKEMFIVSFDISTSNQIRLTIDSMQGVTINDCVDFSRAIEHNLDRDKEDFDIEVSSAGLTEPFRIREQYLKNMGKEIEILMKEGTRISGILTSLDDQGFSVEKTKKVKVEGKKKETDSNRNTSL